MQGVTAVRVRARHRLQELRPVREYLATRETRAALLRQEEIVIRRAIGALLGSQHRAAVVLLAEELQQPRALGVVGHCEGGLQFLGDGLAPRLVNVLGEIANVAGGEICRLRGDFAYC